MPSYLRQSLFTLCLVIFTSSLLTLPWSHLATVTILNRDTVKGWLDKSGAYNKLTNFMIESTKTDSASPLTNEEESLPTKDPRIQQIFNNAIQPLFSPANANKTIDGVYDWLSGKTETLKFTTDLQSIKQRLADELGNYAAEKVSSLPPCTAEQMNALAGTSTDPWSATCVPPGTNPEQIKTDLKNQMLASKDLLGDEKSASVTPEKEIQNNLEGVRTSYKLAVLGPIIFGASAIITGLAAVFLSSSHRKGLQRISVAVISSGIVTGLSTLALHFGLQAIAKSSNEFISGIVIVINGDVSRVLTIWSVSLLVIGAVTFVALQFSGRQAQQVTTNVAKKK